MKINNYQHIKLIFVMLFNFLFITNINGAERHIPDFTGTPLDFYEDNPICKGLYNHTLDYPVPEPHYLEMTPVKNQGPLGTCASFAIGACYEYFAQDYKVSDAEFTILAETYLSGNDGGDCISGLFIGKTTEVAHCMGFIREERLPYEDYLKYVAKKNGVNIKLRGWEERLKDKIESLEEQEEDYFICEKRNTAHHNYDQTIEDYNETLREIGKNISLHGNSSDITSRRLGCIYQIHHISSNILEDFLKGHPCHTETIGKPGKANIHAVRHALKKGYPVPTSLGIVSEYKYSFDNELKHTLFYKKTSIKSDWDTGKSGSYISCPLDKACYRDSSEDKTDNGYRVRGLSHDQVTTKNFYEFSGYHAIVLTGFNDQQRIFQLKNSWGGDWGNNGFAHISYDYIARYATELFAITASK